VFELPQEHDLTVGALGICGVLEGVKNFLKSEDLVGLAVPDLPDVPVGSASDFPEDFVLFQDVLLYILCHGWTIYYIENSWPLPRFGY
jgi:hypothetical protein